MRINKITLELDQEEAVALRSLLEDFFKMQFELDRAEGSFRTDLAKKFLTSLPNKDE